jgi:hypothetical protein
LQNLLDTSIDDLIVLVGKATVVDNVVYLYIGIKPIAKESCQDGPFSTNV